MLYSSKIFRDSKINSFGIFLALLSGNRSTQNLIESCPKLLSMFVCKFEKGKSCKHFAFISDRRSATHDTELPTKLNAIVIILVNCNISN